MIIIIDLLMKGEMTEWSIVAVSKTVVPLGTVGSNPTLSEKYAVSVHEVPAGSFFNALSDAKIHIHVQFC